MENFDFFKKKNKYEYFASKEYRNDIYQISKGLSEYLREEKIPNIILLDRSARPVWIGIDEYWKENYKNDKKPNIFFLNPEAFDIGKKVVEKNKINEQEMELERLIHDRTGESRLIKLAEEEIETTGYEFDQVFKTLREQKDAPLALFDNCIHSGSTMMRVLGVLQRKGYSDMRVVIANDNTDHSPVSIDKTLNDRAQLILSCGVFGVHSGVKKEEGVVSKFDKNADREQVIRVRQEIRQIIKDKGK